MVRRERKTQIEEEPNVMRAVSKAMANTGQKQRIRSTGWLICEALSDVVREQALPVRDKGRPRWGYCGWRCASVHRGRDIEIHVET